MNERSVVRLAALTMLGSLVACAPPEAAPAEASEATLIASDPMPREVTELLRDPHGCSPADLDRVVVLEHEVRVGRGRHVHVTERFTLRGLLRWPHRGVLMLPGTVVTGSFYELDVDGYRFASDLAREGYFTFAIDAEGSGLSSYPSDGASVTHDFLVAEAQTVLRALRALRLIRRMDVLGESNGGSVAAELCADARRTRSCVLSSMIYAEGTPFFEAVFLDPGFIGFLSSQPDNYIDAGPELYFNIAARTTPEVQAAIFATQPGLYATAPLLVATTLPWFDPTMARVPALLIQGTEDNIATQADADALVADYGSAPGAGGHATLVRIAGAGHLPRVEPPPLNETYRDAVVSFLDDAP